MDFCNEIKEIRPTLLFFKVCYAMNLKKTIVTSYKIQFGKPQPMFRLITHFCMCHSLGLDLFRELEGNYE